MWRMGELVSPSNVSHYLEQRMYKSQVYLSQIFLSHFRHMRNYNSSKTNLFNIYYINYCSLYLLNLYPDILYFLHFFDLNIFYWAFGEIYASGKHSLLVTFAGAGEVVPGNEDGIGFGSRVGKLHEGLSTRRHAPTDKLRRRKVGFAATSSKDGCHSPSLG